MTATLDRIDRQLLQLLQHDATLSLQQLADAVHLTSTPCWKRLKKLEELGVIQRRVALLNPEPLGLGLVALVQLKTCNHSESWYQRFIEVVCAFAQVQEFYRMAGDYDYFLKVRVADMAAFDRFYKALVNSIDGLTDISSRFAMEQIKSTTELPL